MKVELIKIKFDGRDVCYKYKPMEYCCDKFRLNPVIELAKEEDCSVYCNNCEKRKEMIYNEEVCNSCSIYNKESFENDDLIPGFFIYSSEEIHDWEDSWLKEDYYKVDFCPHCGEKIEISVVDEIDANEKYRELTFERNELNEKRRKTDSKKKEYELTQKIQELDRLINDFYCVNEYRRAYYA